MNLEERILTISQQPAAKTRIAATSSRATTKTNGESTMRRVRGGKLKRPTEQDTADSTTATVPVKPTR